MERVAIILLGLAALVYGVGGLTEEITNLTNLKDNIEKTLLEEGFGE